MKSLDDVKIGAVAVAPWCVPSGMLGGFLAWGAELELALRIAVGLLAVLWLGRKHWAGPRRIQDDDDDSEG